ncbi:hypothetical protein [Gemmatimonas phototrophica]|uniref:Lipoprotein n=1 Tax=Gemmatimonas phototrophica TaxID=1379270 RepID=A0A143BN06_9BACT|nr:hypothetical protein [Gemmatimonas phototrophica]AMW05955.1 hypothetical protein GEMMAAP_16470 [Gemmatimonas phototrophica]
MSTSRRTSRRSALLLLLGALAGTTACFSKGASGSGQPSVILIANNRGFYDVNIYSVRSGQTQGRRLATVTGNSTQTIKVPVTELQPGSMLSVQVRSVGGRYSWISPTVQMGPGVIARLDVIQTANGTLSQSQMYSQVAPQ